MQTDELIDAIDDNGARLGTRGTLDELVRLNLRYPIVEIWLGDSRGQVLIQQRARLLSYAQHWDATAAGHVKAGEEPATAATRELEEEIGVKVEPEEVILAGARNVSYPSQALPPAKQREYIYVHVMAELPDHLKLQAAEVASTRILSLDELEREIERDTRHRLYVPRGAAYTQAITALRAALKHPSL